MKCDGRRRLGGGERYRGSGRKRWWRGEAEMVEERERDKEE